MSLRCRKIAQVEVSTFLSSSFILKLDGGTRLGPVIPWTVGLKILFAKVVFYCILTLLRWYRHFLHWTVLVCGVRGQHLFRMRRWRRKIGRQMYPTWRHPNCRCVVHLFWELATGFNFTIWTLKLKEGGGIGLGPLRDSDRMTMFKIPKSENPRCVLPGFIDSTKVIIIYFGFASIA